MKKAILTNSFTITEWHGDDYQYDETDLVTFEKGIELEVLKHAGNNGFGELYVVYYEKFNESFVVNAKYLEFISDDSFTNAMQNQVEELIINVKYFDDEIEKISKISKGDWIDLRSSETVELKSGDFKLIKLGVGMKLPDGYEAHVVPRSSTFKTWGILQTNSIGIIDNSYSGNDDQWRFPVLAMRDTIINKGDRICQFRIVKSMDNVSILSVSNLDEVSRGGFGTTGKN